MVIPAGILEFKASGRGEESMAAICRRLHDGGGGMVSDAGKGVVTIYRARLLSSPTVLLATGCASVTARTPPGAGMRKEWGDCKGDNEGTPLFPLFIDWMRNNILARTATLSLAPHPTSPSARGTQSCAASW